MTETGNYRLGLDIGSASIGWAAIALDGQDRATRVLRMGVRIFDPGVDGDIANGRDESKAVARRQARLQRRQLRRRAARQRETFAALQRAGLLPGENCSNVERHELLNALDLDLSAQARTLAGTEAERRQSDEAMPYVLRREALDHALTPHQLGRVFYHLAQRRGFQSNRKESRGSAEEKKEQGKVKEGIGELKAAMSGSRTLGEYFSRLDPHQRRIRVRWTARGMFEDEFEQIWKAQAPHHACLTKEFKREMRELLFFQRPIAKQDNLVGMCELEEHERRAPMATLEAQRFRLLQKLNDLRIESADGLNSRTLTEAERAAVLAKLEGGDQKFDALRKALGLSKTDRFNLERGGEKTMRGDRTTGVMRAVFEERWQKFSPLEKGRAVKLWMDEESEEKLVAAGRDDWQLDEEHARLWASKEPEPNYAMLSQRAMRKLLPLMETGTAFKTAEKEMYGERPLPAALDLLPPVHDGVKTLRNPAVERALTELRKVINALVREYGKPHDVRIELARDLKNPRKERQALSEKIRKQEQKREHFARQICAERNNPNPSPVDLKRISRDDIERALLHEECKGVCPYTGRPISFSALFSGEVDVEHIIPFSRCPDNSFGNKTLCWAEENRNYKKNRTPFEAYGGDAERWNAILLRVAAFKNHTKMLAFQAETAEKVDEFTSRQMNDTRYISRLAGEYLALLYGARIVEGRQIILATSGRVTHMLRKAWSLESILREAMPSSNGENKGKPRTDHRHHAVDALVIALSGQSVIQQMSVAAGAAVPGTSYERLAARVQAPWKDFVETVRPEVLNMVVSHRPEHKLNGPLHKETNYGRPRQVNGKSIVHLRTNVVVLGKNDVENIVDPAVREVVRSKLLELGDLKKCEAGAGNWPMLVSKSGEARPVRKVRVAQNLNVMAVGRKERERFVVAASNHHIAVFAELDKQGREVRWHDVIVSTPEAADRLRRKRPLVERKYAGEENAYFKFSLMGGDIIELHRDCKHEKEVCIPGLYRLRTIATNGQLSLVKITEARLIADIKKAKEWWSPMIDTLRKMECRKVMVDVLGRVHGAND